MRSVAVVILNYNGQKYLEKFLPTVVRYSEGSQIVVADNRSTDNSLLYVETNFPQVRLIRLLRNEGFSRGYNLALQQVKADYYVLLNSDVEVTPGWLSPLLALMDTDSSIAACQPKIKSYLNKHLFEYAGAAGGFIDRWGYPFCRGRIFQHVEKDNYQYNNPIEVFWATGACMVVRSELYWAMKGLDDDFFAHMEEIDLCWRFKNAGYKIFYCPESEVYHVGGGTLAPSNPRKTFLNFRNGIALLYKNIPSNQLIPTIFIRLVLDGVAAFYFLFTSSVGDFLAVGQAHLNFYRNYKSWRQKRKEALGKENGLQHKQIYNKSIVYAYYIRGKKKFNELYC